MIEGSGGDSGVSHRGEKRVELKVPTPGTVGEAYMRVFGQYVKKAGEKSKLDKDPSVIQYLKDETQKEYEHLGKQKHIFDLIIFNHRERQSKDSSSDEFVMDLPDEFTSPGLPLLETANTMTPEEGLALYNQWRRTFVRQHPEAVEEVYDYNRQDYVYVHEDLGLVLNAGYDVWHSLGNIGLKEEQEAVSTGTAPPPRVAVGEPLDQEDNISPDGEPDEDLTEEPDGPTGAGDLYARADGASGVDLASWEEARWDDLENEGALHLSDLSYLTRIPETERFPEGNALYITEVYDEEGGDTQRGFQFYAEFGTGAKEITAVPFSNGKPPSSEWFPLNADPHNGGNIQRDFPYEKERDILLNLPKEARDAISAAEAAKVIARADNDGHDGTATCLIINKNSTFPRVEFAIEKTDGDINFTGSNSDKDEVPAVRITMAYPDSEDLPGRTVLFPMNAFQEILGFDPLERPQKGRSSFGDKLPDKVAQLCFDIQEGHGPFQELATQQPE